jgi:hypothetical protein
MMSLQRGGTVVQGCFGPGFTARTGILRPVGTHSTLQLQRASPATPLAPNLANFPRTGGQRLPPAVQRDMENVFGTRFGDVRIHVGPHAASIRASAFTQGPNVYFAPGHYSPATPHAITRPSAHVRRSAANGAG